MTIKSTTVKISNIIRNPPLDQVLWNDKHYFIDAKRIRQWGQVRLRLKWMVLTWTVLYTEAILG